MRPNADIHSSQSMHGLVAVDHSIPFVSKFDGIPGECNVSLHQDGIHLAAGDDTLHGSPDPLTAPRLSLNNFRLAVCVERNECFALLRSCLPGFSEAPPFPL